MISCAHNIAIIRTNLSNFCVILCINNLAHFKQALLEHLVFFLQSFHRLRQLVLCFLLLAGFFLCGQFFGSVTDVLLDRNLFHPFLLCLNAGAVHDLLHVLSAVRILGHGLQVPLFLHAFHGGVLHRLGAAHQIPKRQVRGLNGCTVLVNDLHASFLLPLRHAVPDVNIVGGGLHRATCAVDCIGAGSIESTVILIQVPDVAITIRDSANVFRGSKSSITAWFINGQHAAIGRTCDVRQTSLHRASCCVSSAGTHQHPLRCNLLPCAAKQGGRAGGVGALVDAAHGMVCKLLHFKKPVYLFPCVVVGQVGLLYAVFPRARVAVPRPDGIGRADHCPPAVFSHRYSRLEGFRRGIPTLCTNGDGAHLLEIFFGALQVLGGLRFGRFCGGLACSGGFFTCQTLCRTFFCFFCGV
nr:MAG TPA: hypothetical protein [Caudoviricetes sp.]